MIIKSEVYVKNLFLVNMKYLAAIHQKRLVRIRKGHIFGKVLHKAN